MIFRYKWRHAKCENHEGGDCEGISEIHVLGYKEAFETLVKWNNCLDCWFYFPISLDDEDRGFS